MARLGEEVESLGLDVGIVQGNPFEVFLGQFGVCGLAGLLAHGLDGLGTILGFLGTSDGGQAGLWSTKRPNMHTDACPVAVYCAEWQARYSRRLCPIKHFAGRARHYPKKVGK